MPSVILGHVVPPPAPEELLWQWNADPLVLVPLLLAVACYAWGARALLASSRSRVLRWRRLPAAWGALAVLVLALVSPVDAWGKALFSAHMGQHLLLMVVAAPLVVLAAPELVWPRVLPPGTRRQVRGWWRRRRMLRMAVDLACAPAGAWALHAGALWFWHIPGPYQVALENDLVHALEHVSFLGTGILFWRVVLLVRARRPWGHGGAALYVFTMALQGAVLGALVAYAPSAWYPIHAEGAELWGLSPLHDQQLAGVLMWVPAGFVYGSAVLWLLRKWIETAERRRARLDQLRRER